MAEKRKHTAHINRKGLDATGVTEDHARGMASSLGSATLLICEAHHATVTTDEEGNQSVALTLSIVEPVPDHMDERVRTLMRALYRQRPEVQGQEVLRGVPDNAPTVEGAMGDLDAVVTTDKDGEPAIWDGSTDED